MGYLAAGTAADPPPPPTPPLPPPCPLQFKVGDKVFALTPGFFNASGQGCYAEFVAADADWVARVPDNLPLDQAAGLPLVALTAWQALQQAGPKAGQRCLVNAASGGVGHQAVQVRAEVVAQPPNGTNGWRGGRLPAPAPHDPHPTALTPRSWPRLSACTWWASPAPRTRSTSSPSAPTRCGEGWAVPVLALLAAVAGLPALSRPPCLPLPRALIRPASPLPRISIKGCGLHISGRVRAVQGPAL